MGLFDNIIGTANDGEAATDMDTIIENMAHPKDIPATIDESSSEWSGSWTGTGSGGSGDDTKDDKKKKKEKKHTDDEEKKEDTAVEIDTTTMNKEAEVETEIEAEAEIESEIDIGWDMSAIDLTVTDEIVVSGKEAEGSIEILSEQVVETPVLDIWVTIDPPPVTPAGVQESNVPVPPVDTNNPDTMPTEPVTSLLDITEPTPPQVSILDIGADVIVPDQVISPITPAVDVPTPAMRTPMSGSLGEKIGGFADELRWLKAADEILLQEKQDAKKRLEDAKKAIEDAEIAIDTEIQRIRDDEAAIDDTLASLKKR
jgi:hypothetical protein